MSTFTLDVRDAGTLDLDDSQFTFEEDERADREHQGCLPNPYPTYVPLRRRED